MTPHPEFIAFYGTLRADCGGVLEAELRVGLEFCGYCEIEGGLLLVKSTPEESYPGLVEGNGLVKAELYELPSGMDFSRLDGHEGSEYQRRSVRLPQPGVECWVYVYTGSQDNRREITSGDWGNFASIYK